MLTTHLTICLNLFEKKGIKMKQMARLFLIFSIACLFCLLMCGTALAIEYDVVIDGGDIVIAVNPDGTTMDITQGGVPFQQNVLIDSTLINISQTSSGELNNFISIVGDGTLTTDPIQIIIQNLNLSSSDNSPFNLTAGANVKLILDGNNNVLEGGVNTDSEGYAGLHVPADSKILITSKGTVQKKLTAIGGIGSAGGSGIGGNGAYDHGGVAGIGETSGEIHIENCEIYAASGSSSGSPAFSGGSGIGGGGGVADSGIGGGGGDSGKITIIDSTVYAKGGKGGVSGGGSGIGGGGGMKYGGGDSGEILINNSTIYVAGGMAPVSDAHGSGIGGGGGYLGASGSGGGSGTNTIITGENTNVVVLSGGIGGGYGNLSSSEPNGVGLTIIENGNILIYDTHSRNVFYNATGGIQLYPLTFTVINKDTGIGIPQTQVTAGIYQMLTRSNASDALTAADFNLVGLNISLFADGTATVWLPNGYDSFLFNAAGYEQLQLPNLSVVPDGAVADSDLEAYGRNVNIPLTAIRSPGTSGGNTTGGGIIVNQTNETKPVPKEPKNNTTPPTPAIPKEPDKPDEPKSNVSVFVIILIYVLAIMTGIAVLYSENRRGEQK